MQLFNLSEKTKLRMNTMSRHKHNGVYDLAIFSGRKETFLDGNFLFKSVQTASYRSCILTFSERNSTL